MSKKFLTNFAFFRFIWQSVQTVRAFVQRLRPVRSKRPRAIPLAGRGEFISRWGGSFAIGERKVGNEISGIGVVLIKCLNLIRAEEFIKLVKR